MAEELERKKRETNDQQHQLRTSILTVRKITRRCKTVGKEESMNRNSNPWPGTIAHKEDIERCSTLRQGKQNKGPAQNTDGREEYRRSGTKNRVGMDEEGS